MDGKTISMTIHYRWVTFYDQGKNLCPPQAKFFWLIIFVMSDDKKIMIHISKNLNPPQNFYPPQYHLPPPRTFKTPTPPSNSKPQPPPLYWGGCTLCKWIP